MSDYTPPVADIGFLLSDVFSIDDLGESIPSFAEVNAEFATSILEEAGRFFAETIQPLNLPGDEEGSRLVNGEVHTPKGFAQAYRAFSEAGWSALSGETEYGGQGLPRVLQILSDEMLSAANLSFGLFPGLTRGASEAIAHHASDELKAAYLPKLITGEWTGAMALTEAGAGTDLGLLKTQAAPQADGSYKITGSKIFISSGDHDFGGNIIHLVLARLPDAPKGVKGISLFLVPKFFLTDDGSQGARNTFSVGALEKKMGIHAQPTCVMNYDEATGWLVGEPNKGLAAMFTMMNAERLFVGIQGLGVADAAYQKAARYAKERIQGRSADGKTPLVPIIEHADVRKMLLTIRSFVEAARGLAIWTALEMDKAGGLSDPSERAVADGNVALLTPVIKAAFTDLGFEGAVLAQQVFGGHGYIHEWGVEQFVRDARIAQIYEGTNGVQAADLVGRKLSIDGGALPKHFFSLIEADLTAAPESISDISEPVREAFALLQRATERLRGQTAADPSAPGAAATDYLRFFALVSLGWVWVRIAAAAEKQAAGSDFHRNKLILARFFVSRVLPQVYGLDRALEAGAQTITALPSDDF
ncbi:acyl-CoA dehydrogenase C-terminal domain-containing protein [Pseudochelatococcus contaminans]|uniref:3-methylmercaptopropionyl-CoA dehydrogenase n=1 Tax=Pseudochelatococcus contaminans TaxID=1538103 RepID=A0A7W6EGY8_9HYPH|nr:acyl-CoA dehydrogenase C-terminal domain-containing protein [Pseudochelatococcus contaminans]MBB3809751.1 alkylation response protein AidB-like acyl-CoA dehydrogenase [Pseudochelatococcus contaminans]